MIGRRTNERLVLLGDVTLAPTSRIESMPVGSHCIAGWSGRITVGDRCRIGPGAAISSHASVTIGADVSIGSYVVIQDSDFHTVDDDAKPSTPRPIRIADEVVIGHSVTILPGSNLGAGSEVRSGSVVGGEVWPGDVVAGNPARSASDGAGDRLSVSQVLARVLSLPAPPDAAEMVADLPGFDSLMMLRLLVDIEEIRGIWLDEQVLTRVRTVGDLETLVSTLT